MTEKILNKKKNGMIALILTSLVYIAGIVALIYGAVLIENEVMAGGITLDSFRPH